MNESIIKTLFEPRPPHWGLRGDPHLWQELQQALKEKPLLKTASEFQQQLITLIQELTGHTLTKDYDFFVERYDTGGMSRGLVCSDFWINTAIPLLVKRYAETLKP